MGNNSYSYDANGNMRTRPGPGGTNYLKFDAEDRLVSISLQKDGSTVILASSTAADHSADRREFHLLNRRPRLR